MIELCWKRIAPSSLRSRFEGNDANRSWCVIRPRLSPHCTSAPTVKLQKSRPKTLIDSFEISAKTHRLDGCRGSPITCKSENFDDSFPTPVISTRTQLPMFSDRSNLVREKKFRPVDPNAGKRGHHFRGTLTDDHTLFLLNQQREKRSKIERKSWLARLFRRR